MSWEWSHSPEAYEAARENVLALPQKELAVIYSEIRASSRNPDGSYITSASGLDMEKYYETLKAAEKADKQFLAEQVWAFMEEHRTCDNGGFLAHCCPYGCRCHVVPFERTGQ